MFRHTEATDKGSSFLQKLSHKFKDNLNAENKD